MRIGKSIWLAKRADNENATMAEYGTPTEIITRTNYLTIMPASVRGYVEVLKSGETLYNTWIGVANSVALDGVFSVGDVVWLDGDAPIAEVEELYGNGASATAVVESVEEANRYINIRLKRRQSQVKNL